MADVQRLRAVLAHIEAHRELWEQGSWSIQTECGTARCFAGWTLALEGIPTRPDMIGSGWMSLEDAPDWIQRKLQRVGSSGYREVPISDVARTLLDIDHWQADLLFLGSNTLDGLRMMVDRLCAEQPSNDAPAGRGWCRCRGSETRTSAG